MSILQAPGPIPSPDTSVLLDNSTYFSAKVAVGEALINARSVFNLATLLEAIVFKEHVFFAPTAVWKPTGEDDLLFGPDRPCHTIDTDTFKPDDLRALFARALKESLADLSGEPRIALTPHAVDAIDLLGTTNTLLHWNHILDRDLDKFITIYSAKVLGTDPASTRYLATLPHTGNEGQPAETQFAHYLLRTNTALHLSGAMPYLPHSNRVQFVLDKLQEQLPGEQAPDLNLLRVTEDRLPTSAPLILTVALSGARTPEDIFRRALSLRREKTAQHFRAWSATLLDAWTADDSQRREEAQQSYAEARDALVEELAKLHGRRFHGARVWQYIKGLAPEIANQEWPKLIVRGLDAADWLATTAKKRRVAVFVELARRAEREFDDLSDQLTRVFGKHNRLSSEELQQLHFLRGRIRK